MLFQRALHHRWLSVQHLHPAAAPVSSTAPSVRAQTKTEPVTKTVAESPPAASAVLLQLWQPIHPHAPVIFQAPRFDLAYLDNPPPRYPRTARQMGWEGTVLLRVKVNSQGRADVIRLARSSGYLPLDEAAQEAVARWRLNLPARESRRCQHGPKCRLYSNYTPVKTTPYLPTAASHCCSRSSPLKPQQMHCRCHRHRSIRFAFGYRAG